MEKLLQRLNDENKKTRFFYEDYLSVLLDESSRREDRRSAYHNLHGAIWGLNTTGYITDEERSLLAKELLDILYPEK